MVNIKVFGVNYIFWGIINNKWKGVNLLNKFNKFFGAFSSGHESFKSLSQ